MSSDGVSSLTTDFQSTQTEHVVFEVENGHLVKHATSEVLVIFVVHTSHHSHRATVSIDETCVMRTRGCEPPGTEPECEKHRWLIITGRLESPLHVG